MAGVPAPYRKRFGAGAGLVWCTNQFLGMVPAAGAISRSSSVSLARISSSLAKNRRSAIKTTAAKTTMAETTHRTVPSPRPFGVSCGEPSGEGSGIVSSDMGEPRNSHPSRAPYRDRY